MARRRRRHHLLMLRKQQDQFTICFYLVVLPQCLSVWFLFPLHLRRQQAVGRLRLRQKQTVGLLHLRLQLVFLARPLYLPIFTPSKLYHSRIGGLSRLKRRVQRSLRQKKEEKFAATRMQMFIKITSSEELKQVQRSWKSLDTCLVALFERRTR